MAKNYSFYEATKIISEDKDKEAMLDIGRRYPLMSMAIAALLAKAGESFVNLTSYLPEHLTANKVNAAMKADISTSEESDDEVEEESEVKETKSTKGAKPKADAESSGDDYDSMNGKELWAILGERGLRKACGSTKKADMVAFLKADDAKGTEANDEDDSDEMPTESNGYEDMSAKELFNICKERKIKAALKKPAKYYIDLLVKYDAENADDTEPDGVEDWDDEVEDKKPAKPAKKDKSAETSKPAKEEVEDDEDWDI